MKKVALLFVLTGGFQLNYFVNADINKVMNSTPLAFEIKISKIF